MLVKRKEILSLVLSVSIYVSNKKGSSIREDEFILSRSYLTRTNLRFEFLYRTPENKIFLRRGLPYPAWESLEFQRTSKLDRCCNLDVVISKKPESSLLTRTRRNG